VAFVQGMADRNQRMELIRAQQTGSLDQAIDWVISLEREEANYDQPRGRELFRTKRQGNAAKRTMAFRHSEANEKWPASSEIDRITTQLKDLKLLVQQQSDNQASSLTARNTAYNTEGRPRVGGHPPQGHQPNQRGRQLTFQANSFKEISIVGPHAAETADPDSYDPYSEVTDYPVHDKYDDKEMGYNFPAEVKYSAYSPQEHRRIPATHQRRNRPGAQLEETGPQSPHYPGPVSSFQEEKGTPNQRR